VQRSHAVLPDPLHELLWMSQPLTVECAPPVSAQVGQNLGAFAAANFVAEEGVVGLLPSADVDEPKRHVRFAHEGRDSFT